MCFISVMRCIQTYLWKCNINNNCELFFIITIISYTGCYSICVEHINPNPSHVRSVIKNSRKCFFILFNELLLSTSIYCCRRRHCFRVMVLSACINLLANMIMWNCFNFYVEQWGGSGDDNDALYIQDDAMLCVYMYLPSS